MKPFPDSARINIPPSVATQLLSAAQMLPPYEDASLREAQTQTNVYEQMRVKCPDSFDWLVQEIDLRLSRAPFSAHICGLTFDTSNLLFVSLARAFGNLVEPFHKPWSRLVQRIQPANDRAEDGYGPLNEQLHTDGTDWREQNDLTCLLCIQADQHGHGHTRLLDIEQLLKELKHNSAPEVLQVLYEEPVPWQIAAELGGDIFWTPVFGQDYVRYMRYTIDLALKEQAIDLSPAVLNALALLDHTIENPLDELSLMMQPKDMLFINNKLSLHGRTKIPHPKSSKRELLRIKVTSRLTPQTI
jgi:Taurine catabolism dioxygenase TauD, TfdA family